MKLTLHDAMTAVATLSCISGFPAHDGAQRMVAHSLFRMVSTREQLFWLLDVATKHMRRFSLPELRGIYCTRYAPADGDHAFAEETDGFTPADLERRVQEADAAEYEAKLKSWQQDQKFLTGDIAPEPIPPLFPEKANVMPPPRKGAASETAPDEDRAMRKARLEYAEQTLKETLEHCPKRSEEESADLVRLLEESLKRKKA